MVKFPKIHFARLVEIDKAIDAYDGMFPGNEKQDYLHALGPELFYLPSRWSRVPSATFVCTRAEFEARKAQRQNKPDWKDSPKWANWLAQHSDAVWYWHSSQPKEGTFERLSGLMERADKGEVIGRWQNTLEQRPNHIAEPNEKVVFFAQASERALAEMASLGILTSCEMGECDCGEQDWYDYKNQTVTKLPPIGAEFELFPFFHLCEVVAHHDGGAVVYDKKELEYVHIKWGDFRCRPLDFDRKPELSPEIGFHLSAAFNELQASARLLPESDPRKQVLTGIAAAVNVVREVA